MHSLLLCLLLLRLLLLRLVLLRLLLLRLLLLRRRSHLKCFSFQQVGISTRQRSATPPLR